VKKEIIIYLLEQLNINLTFKDKLGVSFQFIQLLFIMPVVMIISKLLKSYLKLLQH
jgi:hypothetical protein